MKELLKRWAELEPERCEVPPKTLDESIFSNPDFTIYGNEYSTFWYSDNNVEEAEVLIQGAVQQAIEAQGWNIKAFMSHGSYEIWIDHNSMRSYVGRSKDSPAEAILEAYLQTIESIQS